MRTTRDGQTGGHTWCRDLSQTQTVSEAGSIRCVYGRGVRERVVRFL